MTFITLKKSAMLMAHFDKYPAGNLYLKSDRVKELFMVSLSVCRRLGKLRDKVKAMVSTTEPTAVAPNGSIFLNDVSASIINYQRIEEHQRKSE